MIIERDYILYHKDKELLKHVNNIVIPRFKENVKDENIKSRYIEYVFRCTCCFGYRILKYDREYKTFEIN